MSFKTLEQRFNETTNKLYAGAKYKFENGRASTGLNDDPLIVRAPGKGYWNFAESRSTPIASAANDVKRMVLFTTSVRGVRFLLKQQILQTGNTFESTRIINPAFHISNAVPFLHTKRMLDVPITGRGIARAVLGNNALTRRLFGSGEQRKDIESLRRIAQLQEETYNQATQAISVKSFIQKIPVIGQTISAVRAKRSVGDGVKPYENSRPELSKMGLRGAITALFSGNRNASSGYAMANQVITNSKTKDKYSTSFEPKYIPRLSGTYSTYTNLGNGETKWVVGERLNHYVNLRRMVVSKAGRTRIDFVGDNLIIRLSPTAKEKRLGIMYEDSADKKIIDGNITLDRYVDYGSAERFNKKFFEKPTVLEKKKLLETTAYENLTIREDIDEFIDEKRYVDYGSATRYQHKHYTDNPEVPDEKKQIENDLYLLSDTLPNLTEGIDVYVKNQALESQTARELSTGIVKTSGQPVIKNAAVDGVSYIKYFNYGAGTIKQASVDDIKEGKSTNAQTVALGPDGKRRVISYIKDVSNNEAYVKNSLVSREAYSRIESVFEDPIVVSFAMGIDGHVRFRAYIKDLVQNANPKYNPLQYIGRMEQFIYYTGVQREVSFKLGLIAFSRDELDGLWRRLNYLTGMAYPYGFNKGIFQPNIVRMTIGDVYVDQPGYVTSMNTNFSEIVETWELNSGKQVPISATVSMTFTLIEKASRIADSPFYGITENLDGFSKQIPTAGVNDESIPSNDEAIRDNIQTRNLQGFDEQDNIYTNAILDAARRGDNVSVANIGAMQARRREDARQNLLGGPARRNLQGFDAQDDEYTKAIVAASRRGDTVSVANIGAMQARRREEYRQTLAGNQPQRSTTPPGN